MSDSLTEIMVERFYCAGGYLVERGVPIVAEVGHQFWSDLDVLAISGGSQVGSAKDDEVVKDEVVLVNCKDFVTDPRQKTKIAENLTLAENWVKCHFAALVANKPITRQFVYGGSDKATIEFLQKQGIECLSLQSVLGQYCATLIRRMNATTGKIHPSHGKAVVSHWQSDRL